MGTLVLKIQASEKQCATHTLISKHNKLTGFLIWLRWKCLGANSEGNRHIHITLGKVTQQSSSQSTWKILELCNFPMHLHGRKVGISSSVGFTELSVFHIETKVKLWDRLSNQNRCAIEVWGWGGAWLKTCVILSFITERYFWKERRDSSVTVYNDWCQSLYTVI